MNNKFCDDFCDGTKRCKTINCRIVMQLGQFNTKQKKTTRLFRHFSYHATVLFQLVFIIMIGCISVFIW